MESSSSTQPKVTSFASNVPNFPSKDLLQRQLERQQQDQASRTYTEPIRSYSVADYMATSTSTTNTSTTSTTSSPWNWVGAMPLGDFMPHVTVLPTTPKKTTMASAATSWPGTMGTVTVGVGGTAAAVGDYRSFETVSPYTSSSSYSSTTSSSSSSWTDPPEHCVKRGPSSSKTPPWQEREEALPMPSPSSRTAFFETVVLPHPTNSATAAVQSLSLLTA